MYVVRKGQGRSICQNKKCHTLTQATSSKLSLHTQKTRKCFFWLGLEIRYQVIWLPGKVCMVIWSCMMGWDACFCKSLQCFFHIECLLKYIIGLALGAHYILHMLYHSSSLSQWCCWSRNLCTSTQSYAATRLMHFIYITLHAMPLSLHAMQWLYATNKHYHSKINIFCLFSSFALFFQLFEAWQLQ